MQSHPTKTSIDLQLQFNLIPMLDEFKENENTEYYLNETKRCKYKVYFNKYSQLCDSNHNPLGCGKFLVILDREKNLYAVNVELHKYKEWKHSYIPAGDSVLFPGFIFTDEDSQPYLLNNDSGHYTPRTPLIRNALQLLYNMMTANHTNPLKIKYECHDNAPPPKKEITLYNLLDLLNNLQPNQNLETIKNLILKTRKNGHPYLKHNFLPPNDLSPYPNFNDSESKKVAFFDKQQLVSHFGLKLKNKERARQFDAVESCKKRKKNENISSYEILSNHDDHFYKISSSLPFFSEKQNSYQNKYSVPSIGKNAAKKSTTNHPQLNEAYEFEIAKIFSINK